jgi:hypothetical protein
MSGVKEKLLALGNKQRDEQAKFIEHMLSEVESALAEKCQANDFIESIRDQFDKSGWLTQNQTAALGKFYDNL